MLNDSVILVFFFLNYTLSLMDEPDALLILHRSLTSVMQITLPLLRGGEAQVTSDVITLPIVMKFTTGIQ